jgi:lipopolysaccharide exporter
MIRLIEKAKQIISRSSFVQHVMVVSGSVAIGQVISTLVGPINSRLYKPSDYGTLSIFGAIFGVLGVLGTMQYEMALGTVDEDDDAFHLLFVCILFILIWSVLITAIIFFYSNEVTSLFSKNDPNFRKFIWFLPLGIGFYSIIQTFSRWAMRKHQFPKISLTQVMNNVIGSACTVTLGFMGAGIAGLILGSIAASLYSVISLSSVAFADLKLKFKALSLRSMINTAKQQYRFPLYTTWSVLLNSLSVYIPIFILTKGFGNTYTGYFSLCQRILYLPTLLISGAITPVFYSRAKQAQKDGTLPALTTTLINAISGINIFFPVFIGFFGEWLFAIIFGSQWQRAGQYAAAQAPWMFFSFLVYPLEALPLIFDKQNLVFVFQLIQFILRTGSLLIGVFFHNDMLAMWLFGGTSAIYMLFYFIWLFKLVNGPIVEVLLKLGKDLAFALVVFGACRTLMWFLNDNIILLSPLLVPVLAYFCIRGVRQMMLALN